MRAIETTLRLPVMSSIGCTSALKGGGYRQCVTRPEPIRIPLTGCTITTSSRAWASPDEDIVAYAKSIRDLDQWVLPQPPVQKVSTVTMKSIVLTTLPFETDVATQPGISEFGNQDACYQPEYRASIAFEINSSPDPVIYTLYTNPVFIMPPDCKPGPVGAQHQAHPRELHCFSRQHDYNVTKSKGYWVMLRM
ncbi:hypothetical protein FQN49_000943 [Arthroderma sp. PD_2]|nr:hypothetical protein FQN49_000943 [Arthroderma sp. PD_2]